MTSRVRLVATLRRLPRLMLAPLLCAVLIISFLIVARIGGSAAIAQYQIIDFGTLPEGTSPVVRGLNNSGQFVGGSRTSGREPRGFVVSGTQFEEIGPLPGGDYSTAFSINDDGRVVVGSSNTLTALRAFRWTRQDG